MPRKFAAAIFVLGLAAGASVLGTSAQAQGVKVGVLTCNVSSGFGFVFGSSRSINCTFAPPGGAAGALCRGDQQIRCRYRLRSGWSDGLDGCRAFLQPRPGSVCRELAGRPQAPRSGSGSELMCWSAAPAIPSRCSPSALKATPVSMSLAGIAEMTLTFQPG